MVRMDRSEHSRIGWSAVLTGMIITKNGTDETTPEYDILYITRTGFFM
jgi:hypothetical protein